ELIRQVGEEILTEPELRTLLDSKKKPIAYDGFEPSGQIHIAQGLLRAINVNKMTAAGCHFKMWIADWHGWANHKLDGNLESIQTAGHYMIEIWKTTGMDLKNTEFVWANDVIPKRDYWKKVVQIARASTVNRIVRTSQIMGRSEKDTLSAAQILYPCMQAADIFQLEVDIAQLGMDQRKVNVLARELAPQLGYAKPVAVHHHMLMGLGQPRADATDSVERAVAMKMSKSNPDSAIFMTDSSSEVERKLKKAYCPEKQVNENPVLEYAKYIVFELNKTVKIERPDKFGGNKEYKSYAELESDFTSGALHPMDLKTAVGGYLNAALEPTRTHFEKNAKARGLLEEITKIQQKK
ncbi:MAG: tyrosine--tRNA ligase, partial [Candidatus Diapherotrites archaeon]|nr:tyrosine--tRNA ligase [Candidatus Diapherotrites archaeon]